MTCGSDGWWCLRRSGPAGVRPALWKTENLHLLCEQFVSRFVDAQRLSEVQVHRLNRRGDFDRDVGLERVVVPGRRIGSLEEVPDHNP